MTNRDAKKKCYSCSWFPWLILGLTVVAIILFVVWAATKNKRWSQTNGMKKSITEMFKQSCENTPLEGFKNKDTICKLLSQLKNAL